MVNKCSSSRFFISQVLSITSSGTESTYGSVVRLRTDGTQPKPQEDPSYSL